MSNQPKIINITGFDVHIICLIRGRGLLQKVYPVDLEHKPPEMHGGSPNYPYQGDLDGVPTFTEDRSYSFTGLPEPKENTIWLVTEAVFNAFPNRKDLITVSYKTLWGDTPGYVGFTVR
jgi:hypothetical protein